MHCSELKLTQPNNIPSMRKQIHFLTKLLKLNMRYEGMNKSTKSKIEDITNQIYTSLMQHETHSQLNDKLKCLQSNIDSLSQLNSQQETLCQKYTDKVALLQKEIEISNGKLKCFDETSKNYEKRINELSITCATTSQEKTKISEENIKLKEQNTKLVELIHKFEKKVYSYHQTDCR